MTTNSTATVLARDTDATPPAREDLARDGLAADGSAVAMTTHRIGLTINGDDHQLEVEPWTTLLDLLRQRLHLTGTKKGCDHGQCGACTVLVDGVRINSCLSLAVMKNGCSVTTIEGLGSDGDLHPLQQAFIDKDAFQCGYCTPGQICSAVGMMAEGHAQTPAEVRELMSGNLCRCGAYPNIVEAVVSVMRQKPRPKPPEPPEPPPDPAASQPDWWTPPPTTPTRSGGGQPPGAGS